MHLLHDWRELAAGRQRDMGTPQPIAWGDIASWSALAGGPLDALHARVLRLIDSAWIEAWHAAQTQSVGAARSP